MGKTPLTATPAEYPHRATRPEHVIFPADDWDEEERSEMSGLRMSLLSVALILSLVAVLAIWNLLPGHYLINYLAQAILWLLAISIPVVALAALVSSVLDLMRISGTAGDVAGKGSAVAGLVLSVLVLALCVFFLFSFKPLDSSQNENASRPKKTFHREDAKYAKKENRSDRVHRELRQRQKRKLWIRDFGPWTQGQTLDSTGGNPAQTTEPSNSHWKELRYE